MQRIAYENFKFLSTIIECYYFQMRIFHITKKVILPSLIIFFLGCASHQKQALSKIQVGMDKADVLEKIGSPTRKARIFGQDRWTYELDSVSRNNYIRFLSRRKSYLYRRRLKSPQMRPPRKQNPPASLSPLASSFFTLK